MFKSLLMLMVGVLFFSCNLPKKIKKNLDSATYSFFITQIATSKALVDATKAIYKKNSLKYNTPVYIHSLEINYKDRIKSYNLVIDSIEAIWTNDSSMIFRKVTVSNDSIFYKDVSIPFLKTYFENDTINVSVVCKYLPYINTFNQCNKFKCLSGHYIIEKQIIKLNKEFENCNAK